MTVSTEHTDEGEELLALYSRVGVTLPSLLHSTFVDKLLSCSSADNGLIVLKSSS